MMQDFLNRQKDKLEFLFRFLFSSIFLGLGLEHLFSDDLILQMMQDWIPMKEFTSKLSGIILLSGGLMIVLGFHIRYAAMMLGLFLIAVTLIIHLPYLFIRPDGLNEDIYWLWDLYQRSNFVKNICLLGVCFHLFYHKAGKYSVHSE